MRRILFVIALLSLLVAGAAAQDEPFNLTILHTNDTHASHRANSAGDGGAAIMRAVVNQVRGSVENTLLLDGGDRFTGTLFHTVYQGADQVQVMNLMGYDAMALGNHEFDNGDEILSQFLGGISFPAVAANVDVVNAPFLNGLVQSSVILDVNGRKVGVIGLTVSETAILSSPSAGVEFSDAYAEIANAEAEKLTAEGANIIIIVSHVGINATLAYLPDVVGIDVVVDGHSHTLLGNAASAAEREYPIVFETNGGETVQYVQAGANAQYLGRLNLTFDADGNVTAASGDTIQLSRYITPDPEMDALVSDLYEEVQALAEQPSGATATELLDGRREVCRAEECVMGNIIADAMRAASGAQIGIMNSGGVRASIEAGDITVGEVLTVQPFSNLVATFELTGDNVILALENGVSRLAVVDGVISRADLSGRFPQVSGIRFVADITQEPGSRIVSVDVENEDGSFSPIDPNVVYTLVTNNFVRTGGDGYSVFAEQAINPYDFGDLDFDVTLQYVEALGTVEPVLEGRITFVNAQPAPLE
jgi:5'-nucleotidase